jgi:adenylate kinase
MLGNSGSGKGTVSKRIAQHFNLPRVSTGDVLRDLAASTHRKAAEAKGVLDKGKYATAKLMYPLVRTLLRQHPGGLILDGFPRKYPQAKWLIERQLPRNATIIALLLDVPAPVVRQRMLARGRDDDNAANIDKRLANYAKESGMLNAYFGELGTFYVVKGGQPPEDVWQATLQTLAPLLKPEGPA